MSEKSDLRDRAREWTTACRAIDMNEYEKEGVGIMRDLIQALDAVEREERERCERISREARRTVSMMPNSKECAAYNCACGDIEIAIRREGGKG